MLHPRSHRQSAAVMLVGFIAASCTDIPVSSNLSGGAENASLNRGGRAVASLASDQVARPEFVCRISRLSPEGPHAYRYSRRALRFSDSAKNPAGATQVVRYRWETSTGQVLKAMNCRIPATPYALELIDRHYKVENRRRRKEDGDAGDLGMSIQSVLVIYDPPDPEPDPGCDLSYCESSMGDQPGGGGGGDPDPGTEPHVDPGEDSLDYMPPPDCSDLTNLDIRAIEWCNGYVPEDQLLARIRSSAQRLRERAGQCIKLAGKLDELLVSGNLKITDNVNDDWAAAASKGGDWAIFVRKWLDVPNEQDIDYLLAHEMDHIADHTYPGTITDDRGHILRDDGTVDRYHTPNSKLCAARSY